jgi:hypothetical protein
LCVSDWNPTEVGPLGIGRLLKNNGNVDDSDQDDDEDEDQNSYYLINSVAPDLQLWGRRQQDLEDSHNDHEFEDASTLIQDAPDSSEKFLGEVCCSFCFRFDIFAL